MKWIKIILVGLSLCFSSNLTYGIEIILGTIKNSTNETLIIKRPNQTVLAELKPNEEKRINDPVTLSQTWGSWGSACPAPSVYNSDHYPIYNQQGILPYMFNISYKKHPKVVEDRRCSSPGYQNIIFNVFKTYIGGPTLITEFTSSSHDNMVLMSIDLKHGRSPFRNSTGTIKEDKKLQLFFEEIQKDNLTK